MKLIALVEAPDTIQDILSHLGLWEAPLAGPAPPPPRLELQYEPCYDDIPFGPGDTFAA